MATSNMNYVSKTISLNSDVSGDAMKEGGSGIVLVIRNSSNQIVAHIVFRPKNFQSDIAIEAYSGDWSVMAWKLVKSS